MKSQNTYLEENEDMTAVSKRNKPSLSSSKDPIEAVGRKGTLLSLPRNAI